MNRKLAACLIMLSAVAVSAHPPYQKVLPRIKPAVVGIEAHDDTLVIGPNGVPVPFASYGSGAIVGTDSLGAFALTNEHVIAIKDSLGRTIRYANRLLVSINLSDGDSAFSCRGEIRRADGARDLAALRIFFPEGLGERLDMTVLHESSWQSETELEEGETVVYSGYPLRMGRGVANAPLSRTGTIAQIVSGRSSFLIDAFVQGGYSGSPIFHVAEVPGRLPSEWTIRFAGLCQAYPWGPQAVMKRVAIEAIPGVFVRENPGFTQVIGVSAIRAFFDDPSTAWRP